MIRDSFIANSSSTAFIACIPSRFRVEEYLNLVEEQLQRYVEENTSTRHGFTKVISQIFDELKEGYSVCLMDESQFMEEAIEIILTKCNLLLLNSHKELAAGSIVYAITEEQLENVHKEVLTAYENPTKSKEIG